jgi:hypothetical protein
MARRACPSCKGDFLIQDGKAVRDPDARKKKPSGKA